MSLGSGYQSPGFGSLTQGQSIGYSPSLGLPLSPGSQQLALSPSYLALSPRSRAARRTSYVKKTNRFDIPLSTGVSYSANGWRG